MPVLEILDGFCFDCGHYMGVSCPRCTNAKPPMHFMFFNPNWICHIRPQESAEDDYGLLEGSGNHAEEAPAH